MAVQITIYLNESDVSASYVLLRIARCHVLGRYYRDNRLYDQLHD